MGLGDFLDQIASGFSNFGNTVENFFSDVGMRGAMPSDEGMFKQMLGQQENATGASDPWLQATMAAILGINPGGEMNPHGYTTPRPGQTFQEWAVENMPQSTGLLGPSRAMFEQLGGRDVVPSGPVPEANIYYGPSGELPNVPMAPRFARINPNDLNIIDDTVNAMANAQRPTMDTMLARALENKIRSESQARSLLSAPDRTPLVDALPEPSLEGGISGPVSTARLGETLPSQTTPELVNMLRSLIERHQFAEGQPNPGGLKKPGNYGMGSMPREGALPWQRLNSVDNAIDQRWYKGHPAVSFAEEAAGRIARNVDRDQIFATGPRSYEGPTVERFDANSAPTTLERLLRELAAEGKTLGSMESGWVPHTYHPVEATAKSFLLRALGYQQGIG